MSRREVLEKIIEAQKVGLSLTAAGGILVPQIEIDQRLKKIEHLKKLLAMPEIDKDMKILNGLVDHICRRIVVIEIQEVALAAKKEELRARRALIEEIMAIPLWERSNSKANGR